MEGGRYVSAHFRHNHNLHPSSSSQQTYQSSCRRHLRRRRQSYSSLGQSWRLGDHSGPCCCSCFHRLHHSYLYTDKLHTSLSTRAQATLFTNPTILTITIAVVAISSITSTSTLVVSLVITTITTIISTRTTGSTGTTSVAYNKGNV